MAVPFEQNPVCPKCKVARPDAIGRVFQAKAPPEIPDDVLHISCMVCGYSFDMTPGDTAPPTP